MLIESTELKKSIEYQKTKDKDLVSELFNRGIETALAVIKIHEDGARFKEELRAI